MMRILRLAASVLAITPTQHWANGIGLAFLLPALVCFRQPWSGPVSIVGLLFIAIIPLLLGGPSMRIIAARRSFRLRPHGPRQLLAAAAVVLLAFALVTTALILHAGAVAPANPALRFAPTFVAVLSALTLCLTCTFAMAGSRAIFYIVFTLLITGRYWVPYAARLPEPRLALAGAALAAWVWVAYSLLRRRGVGMWLPVFSPGAIGGDSPADLGKGVTPWTATRLYLMGTTSWWPFLAPAGFLLLALLGAATGLIPRFFAGTFLIFIGQVSLVSGGQMGFSLARRARYLWLRRGTNRADAFRFTERAALLGFALSAGATALVLLALFAFHLPREQWVQAAIYCLVQWLMALCFLYMGLLLTRGWTGPAIVGGIAMFALWVACLAGPRPGAADADLWAAVLLPALAALALACRFAARWRWRGIDWLVFRPTGLSVRGA